MNLIGSTWQNEFPSFYTFIMFLRCIQVMVYSMGLSGRMTYLMCVMVACLAVYDFWLVKAYGYHFIGLNWLNAKTEDGKHELKLKYLDPVQMSGLDKYLARQFWWTLCFMCVIWFGLGLYCCIMGRVGQVIVAGFSLGLYLTNFVGFCLCHQAMKEASAVKKRS